MAILSDDGKYVTVEKGDSLWAIAKTYLGSGTKYKQLAAINDIPDSNLIYVGQKIYLTDDGSAVSTTSSNSNAVTIKQFGELSTSENTLFATWTWGKESNTESYKVVWTYTTIDGIEFVDTSNVSVDKDYYAASRQTTYSIPDGATKVIFKVKPISKTYTKNEKECTYFTANWSSTKTYNVSTPLSAPSTPSVKIDGLKLTAELENVDTIATSIQFRLVKNNTKVVETTKAIDINTTTKYVSKTWTQVETGCEYKVCCRAVKGSMYSEWSDYSSSVSTLPAAPGKITTCRATDATTVYLEWSSANTAKSYDIEHTTERDYFDKSDKTTVVSVDSGNAYYVTGLTSGQEYFFRVRAVNDAGDSEWTDIVSVILGKAPAAPTTWSSTTTAIVGEKVLLYWVHNSEDGSSETYADLELYVDDQKLVTEPIKNTNSEEDKDKTKFYEFDTSEYEEGTTLKWRVRTKGITDSFGDWSVQRTVDIYAEPTLRLSVVDGYDNILTEIASFPFYISAIPGPKTQTPIGYHVSVTADELYETVDAIGNPVTINEGEEVYSKHFDTNYDLMIMMSADNIDLEKNISYTITCTVTMDSGLTAETSVSLPVTWSEVLYMPNASIGIDTDTYTAYITPYCEDRNLVRYLVAIDNDVYSVTDTAVSAYGDPVDGAYTQTGEQVYFGMNSAGEEVYFCDVEEVVTVENVTLSVYRREFDGTFTEIATGLENAKNTTVTDPHPALDYARYRIVATSTETGAVGHYDLPGYPVGGKAVIIQWNEEWSSFEASGEDALAQPPWSGSLLMLPYNIDVSDSHKTDVSLVEYIGRSHPVSYYGTHLGETSSWSMAIDKSDKETLYSLRRLAIWMGDVYVREPSGSGYWANISVSFSQKHCELTIPVTLNITRVEGGV